MSAAIVTNISTINSQQSANNSLDLFSYKEVLRNCMIDYETKIRNSDPASRRFNVYDYVAKLLGCIPGTVRKFFNQFDETGVKLGADDLIRICHLLGTTEPLDAYIENAKRILSYSSNTEINCSNLIQETFDITSKVGEFTGILRRYAADNKLTAGERKSLALKITELKKEISDVEEFFKK